MRLVLGLLLSTVVVFLLVGTDPNRGFVQDIDDAFLELMVDLRAAPVVSLAKWLSIAGGVWVNWPLRVLVMILLGARRRWLQLGAFALAVATSEVLIGVLKDLYARPRPPNPLIGTSGFSFPSGHAIAGAVTAVGVVVVLIPPGRKRLLWELAAALFAGVMALSRTYLGAHWLSDVVSGALLGASLAVGWPALLQEVRERRARGRASAQSAGAAVGSGAG
jgi:undecaprenyl-diphosphatase